MDPAAAKAPLKKKRLHARVRATVAVTAKNLFPTRLLISSDILG
jgi:hypothetical protein